ncbi:MAG: YicC family protein [Planctomycetes bacterium]|nr:YicC family protein [Planctomycetota bacterium]
MIRSMTGFGRAESVSEDWAIRVQVRSVNQKKLQISFHVPDAFRLKEVELERLVNKEIHRGRLYFSLSCEPQVEGGLPFVNREVVRQYLATLKELAGDETLHVDMANVLRLPGAITEMSADRELQERLWPHVVAIAEQALDKLLEMRRVEGDNLTRQFLDLCDTMEEQVDQIELAQRDFVPAYRDRLRTRINRLLAGADIEINEAPLAREVAIYADRCDVSEEIERLRSHLMQFRRTLDGPAEPVGAKMEFIGQEMLREAGAIASKVPPGQHVRQVLELKTTIERLREQVRNVE